MHFPIVELTSHKKTKKEIEESDIDYDDYLLNYCCDYFGEKYSPERREELIGSGWIKSLFDGIADVDAENECVRFYSKEKIQATLDGYYQDVVDKVNDGKELRGWQKFFTLRQLGFDFRNNCSIFIVDGCCKSSMMFFEDCYFYADNVLYFGQVYDAHC